MTLLVKPINESMRKEYARIPSVRLEK